jgi:hypothetical protein
MFSMTRSLPDSETQIKKYLPQLETLFYYCSPMNPIDTRPILWANLSALMRHHWGKENLARLSQEADIGLASADRMKKQTTSIGLSMVEAVACVFGLQAWQLLTPDLDPADPPVLYLTKNEAAKYHGFKQSAKAFSG